ncbi:ABC transporter substrate-binding protein [Methanosarcina horonobensis]|uniref:ABC transporter substrate-binding protein n=1 Tax=Methanosarcina horonobensis TaxID=418008 RepID=UPI000A6477B8|nr:ABC transporter substrate-binding protein [Methanosarcina horonobensis]
MTDPSGSQHSQVIDICGGINVADCPLTPGNGMTQVSIEQVIEWNPEVIITSNPQFYSTVYSDSLWVSVDAVKNKRVYLAPQNPFCWIDRPQVLISLSELPGLQKCCIRTFSQIWISPS